VVFLRQLPNLTAEEYKALVRSVPRTHRHDMHEGGEENSENETPPHLEHRDH
jgi:hypothetical protein